VVSFRCLRTLRVE